MTDSSMDEFHNQWMNPAIHRSSAHDGGQDESLIDRWMDGWMMDGISKPYLAYPNCTTSVQNLYVSAAKKEGSCRVFIYLSFS